MCRITLVLILLVVVVASAYMCSQPVLIGADHDMACRAVGMVTVAGC